MTAHHHQREHEHEHDHGHEAGDRRRPFVSIAGGLLLVLLGAAMIVVAVTGDSLYYVRDVMTLPLIVSGSFVLLLGLTAVFGLVTPTHVPRSIVLVAVAAAFVLVVRPGPLSVDAGLAYDTDVGGRVRTTFEIPPRSIVGDGADASVIEDRAVELHVGQVHFAAEQFPAEFEQVAIRMIGQFDVDDDGAARLVRFRIQCCAADALRMSIVLDVDERVEPGTWVEVYGQWNGDIETPVIETVSMREIERPASPYLTLRDG